MSLAWLSLLPLLYGVILQSPRYKNRASTWWQVVLALGVTAAVFFLGICAISEATGLGFGASMFVAIGEMYLGYRIACFAYGVPRDPPIVRWDRVRAFLQSSR